MTDDRLDLSALDPTLPSEAFERRVAGVHRAARGELARRREGRGTLFVVARWRAPLMAALLLVMLVSAVMLRAVTNEPDVATDTSVEATDEVADVLGVSSPIGEAILTASSSATDALLGGGFDQ